MTGAPARLLCDANGDVGGPGHDYTITMPAELDGRFEHGLDERGARGEAAVGQAGAQLDARGARPGGDPHAIDRLDTDLDTHEVLSFRIH